MNGSQHLLRQMLKRECRKVAVVDYLRTCGPSTTAEIARALSIKPAALNQWLHGNQRRLMLWVRMPNNRWLLLEEEPVEVDFEISSP